MDISKTRAKTEALCAEVEKLLITSTESYNEGAYFRGVIKGRLKKLEEARKMMTKPHVDKQREINKVFKDQTEPLNLLLNQLDRGMLSFKEEEEAMAKAKALEAKEKDLAPVEAPVRQTRTESGVTSVKEVWRYKIINAEKLFNKYPDFFMPNAKEINKFVQIMSKEGDFDGLHIYKEKTLSTRV